MSCCRYGNSLCLLDATYRTTKYALPLFFLAVKTNVGYSVVAEFLVQHETKSSIIHGLKTIQTWVENAADKPTDWHWEPKFFMTDFCEREIVAIEETFPGICISLSLSLSLSVSLSLFLQKSFIFSACADVSAHSKFSYGIWYINIYQSAEKGNNTSNDLYF